MVDFLLFSSKEKRDEKKNVDKTAKSDQRKVTRNHKFTTQ